MTEMAGELVEWRHEGTWTTVDSTAVAGTSSSRPRSADTRDTATSFHSGLPLTWTGHAPTVPEPSLELQQFLFLKRISDIAMAIAAGIFLGPMLLLTALLIRLTSPGPALFTQERTGLDGKSFRIYKFRTMHLAEGDGTGVRHTVKGDARVTRFGHFLRRTSIDELPQLLNVLKGEMAIVGPRPHPVGMRAAGRRYDELVPYYALRHRLKPGLTGWAQCNGLRGPADDPALARARIEHDLAYIQNASLGLDWRIIWRTVRREFLTGSGL